METWNEYKKNRGLKVEDQEGFFLMIKPSRDYEIKEHSNYKYLKRQGSTQSIFSGQSEFLITSNKELAEMFHSNERLSDRTYKSVKKSIYKEAFESWGKLYLVEHFLMLGKSEMNKLDTNDLDSLYSVFEEKADLKSRYVDINPPNTDNFFKKIEEDSEF